jgi:hypothetical protein
MKGVLPWMVRWNRCAGTRYFDPALADPHRHNFNLRVPIAQQPGQAVAQGRLSLMCISDVYCEEKKFCTGPTTAAKGEQKSLVPA